MEGTLERLMASPVSKIEIALGYMLGFTTFALVQSLMVLLFTIFVLQIHYSGNLLLVFLIEVIITVGSVNMGIFLSTFARNELQVIQFIPLVIVPQFLLSGVIWPFDEMPVLLQAIGRVLPLTYANDAMRSVMIKGFGMSDFGLLTDLAILTVFAALQIWLATLTLRREIA